MRSCSGIFLHQKRNNGTGMLVIISKVSLRQNRGGLLMAGQPALAEQHHWSISRGCSTQLISTSWQTRMEHSRAHTSHKAADSTEVNGFMKEPNMFQNYETEKITRKASDAAENLQLYRVVRFFRPRSLCTTMSLMLILWTSTNICIVYDNLG